MRISGVCELGGVDIHYLRSRGGKRSVVLLHGLTGSGACWTPVARALEGEFDVVMPDARGHGASSAPDHGYHYDDHVRDVEGLIRGLDLSRPVLLGHSMGGMTAAVVARRAAAGLIRAVILVDPTFLSAERQREVHESDVADEHRRALCLERAALVAQARVRHPHRSLEIVELLADARRKTSIHAFDVLTPPNPDYRAVVSAIDVPILLVIGDRNPVVTADMAAELQRLNPGLRVEEIHDAGHGLPFDQPERLGEIVASFLRELT